MNEADAGWKSRRSKHLTGRVGSRCFWQEPSVSDSHSMPFPEWQRPVYVTHVLTYVTIHWKCLSRLPRSRFCFRHSWFHSPFTRLIVSHGEHLGFLFPLPGSELPSLIYRMADLATSGFCFSAFAFVQGVKGALFRSLAEDDMTPASGATPAGHSHPGPLPL